MRNTYEVRAERFIHQLYDYICDCGNYREIENAISRFNYMNRRNVIFRHGLTRIAFITSDYVIKMDFGSGYNMTQFGGCENECRIYEEAVAEGYEYLFAKPTMVEYEGHNFYIMPRIRNIGRYDYDVSEYLTEEENDWVEERVFDLHYRNYGWKDGHPVIFDYAAIT